MECVFDLLKFFPACPFPGIVLLGAMRVHDVYMTQNLMSMMGGVEEAKRNIPLGRRVISGGTELWSILERGWSVVSFLFC